MCFVEGDFPGAFCCIKIREKKDEENVHFCGHKFNISNKSVHEIECVARFVSRK